MGEWKESAGVEFGEGGGQGESNSRGTSDGYVKENRLEEESEFELKRNKPPVVGAPKICGVRLRHRVLSYLPVTVLVLFMSFLVYLVANIVVTVFFGLAVVCFALSIIVHPGRIPSEPPWDPSGFYQLREDDSEESEKLINKMYQNEEEETPQDMFSLLDRDAAQPLLIESAKKYALITHERKASNDGIRFCQKCGKYKPDRTHHSKIAGECILEMDHYCPWLATCIGFENKKYFILLLFYGCLTITGFIVNMARPSIAVFHDVTVLHFFTTLAWLMAIVFDVLLILFFVFHLWLIAHAYTTIEFYEKYLPDTNPKVQRLYAVSPYSHGWYYNFKHVLGPFPILWILPTRIGMDRVGTHISVNKQHPMYKQHL